jgi:hypothetical protein
MDEEKQKLNYEIDAILNLDGDSPVKPKSMFS